VTVIDASTIVKYVLREEGWVRVSKYLRTSKPLYSLDHLVKETANAIWKHATVRNAISSDKALKLYSLFEKLITSEVIVLENELGYMGRAVELALQHGITVYDALYIAQAEKHGKLLTSDEKQAETARKLGIEVHVV